MKRERERWRKVSEPGREEEEEVRSVIKVEEWKSAWSR